MQRRRYYPPSTNDMQPPFTTPLLLADLRFTPPMRAICHPGSRQVYMCVQPIVNPCPLVSPFTVAIMHRRTRFRVRGITSHYAVFVVRGCCIATGTSANSQLYAINAASFHDETPVRFNVCKVPRQLNPFSIGCMRNPFSRSSRLRWLLESTYSDSRMSPRDNQKTRPQIRILVRRIYMSFNIIYILIICNFYYVTN